MSSFKNLLHKLFSIYSLFECSETTQPVFFQHVSSWSAETNALPPVLCLMPGKGGYSIIKTLELPWVIIFLCTRNNQDSQLHLPNSVCQINYLCQLTNRDMIAQLRNRLKDAWGY